MIEGSFLDFHPLPTVKVLVKFDETVVYSQFVLDTGFSGDLKVDPQTAAGLGIENLGTKYIHNANGQRVLVGFAYGFAELENKKKSVEIIVADGPHLLGIGFLAVFGYKSVVDCKNWICHLELAP
jgi:predicted aspartyl protease